MTRRDVTCLLFLEKIQRSKLKLFFLPYYSDRVNILCVMFDRVNRCMQLHLNTFFWGGGCFLVTYVAAVSFIYYLI